MVDVSNALGPNWPSFLALLIVLFGIVWSEHRKRFRERHAPDLSTREGMLEEQVQKLQATVTTLLEDRTAAQKQIDALRRELDEANVKIAQLLAKLGMYEQLKPGETLPVRMTGEILVGVGTDPMLQADLAALRKQKRRRNQDHPAFPGHFGEPEADARPAPQGRQAYPLGASFRACLRRGRRAGG